MENDDIKDDDYDMRVQPNDDDKGVRDDKNDIEHGDTKDNNNLKCDDTRDSNYDVRGEQPNKDGDDNDDVE